MLWDLMSFIWAQLGLLCSRGPQAWVSNPGARRGGLSESAPGWEHAAIAMWDLMPWSREGAVAWGERCHVPSTALAGPCC